MKTFLKFALLLLCLCCGRAALAQDVCPSGSQYLQAGTANTFVTAATLGCSVGAYYAADNGVDSNSGTKASPWLHLPGMQTCSLNCAALQTAGVQPGTWLILKGGDTWHFGNGAAVPYVGVTSTGCFGSFGGPQTCAWFVHWSGSTAHPVYWGVDQNFFTGSAWSRPILNGDNPPTTSTTLTACTFDESALWFFTIHGLSGETEHNILDNFEFTGLCWHGIEQVSTGSGAYMEFAPFTDTAGSFNTAQNLYMHGWSHVNFSTCLGTSGNCDGAYALGGTSDKTLGHGDIYTHVVVDGSDTDTVSMLGTSWACYDVEYSIYRFVADGPVCNNSHTFHDNIIEHMTHSGDGHSHANGSEFNTESATAPFINVFYNNVYGHFQTGGVGCGNVVVWRTPQFTDYAFNNLIYDQDPSCNNSNFWDLVVGSTGQGGAENWTDNEFNNTWVLGANGPIQNNTLDATPTVNFTNNFCITPNGNVLVNCHSTTSAATYNYGNNLNLLTSTATADGYTAAQTYPYSPTTSSSPTENIGANKTATYCAAMLASTDIAVHNAGLACARDNTYACAYDAVNHIPVCPARATIARPISSAWAVGDLQFFSFAIASFNINPIPCGSSAPGVQVNCTTFTITNTGSATLVFSTPWFQITGANLSDFALGSTTCSNGGSVGVGATCTGTLTFTPGGTGARAAVLSVIGNGAGNSNITGTGTGGVSQSGNCTENLTLSTAVTINKQTLGQQKVACHP